MWNNSGVIPMWIKFRQSKQYNLTNSLEFRIPHDSKSSLTIYWFFDSSSVFPRGRELFESRGMIILFQFKKFYKFLSFMIVA